MTANPTQIISEIKDRPSIVRMNETQKNSLEEIEARLFTSLIEFMSDVKSLRSEFDINLVPYNVKTHEWELFSCHYSLRQRYESGLTNLLYTHNISSKWRMPIECMLRTHTLPIFLVGSTVSIFVKPTDNALEGLMESERLKEKPRVLIIINSEMTVTQLNKQLKMSRQKLEKAMATLPKKRNFDMAIETLEIGQEVQLIKQRNIGITDKKVLEELETNHLPGGNLETDYQLRKIHTRYFKALSRYKRDKV